MTGNLLLTGSLATALVAMLACWTKLFSERLIKFSAIASLGLIVVASLYLWILIFRNDFSVEYVANYSSTTLPTIFKISAFWAGQQGSFLLWLLIHAVAGAVLIKNRIQTKALGFYFFLQAMLAFLVLAKSPFAENPVTVAEGFGLNPLLQDFWMAIHPPIIFVGYALLAVPISLSLGALLESAKSKTWLESARKWTLLAWSFLGAGIFIGGYWAYKVLGWGGYWGWDPVENSSLVPWLISAVLLHLLNLAKKKSAVLPMAHIAAVFNYSLVIYGTFLTRSGVLGDFSVHSFAGSNIGIVIAFANAIVLLGGIFIIMLKAKDFPQGKMYENFSEQAFIVLLGALLLVFIAVIVWIGMSMPLLSQLVGESAAVDTDFYTRTTAPLAAVLVALVIFTFAKWSKSISLGGKIAHAGFVLGLAAVVISAQGETLTQELTKGDSVEIAGHKIIYQGQVLEEENLQKFYVYEVDGAEIKALTKLRTNGDDAAREPAILKTVGGDIYVAPHAPENLETQNLILNKDVFAMDGELGYTFKEAEIVRNDSGKPIRAVAKIDVTDGNQTETIEPAIIISADGGGRSQSIQIFDGRRRVRLTGVSRELDKARLEILPTLEELSNLPVTSTINTKPVIWLLWLSVTAICLGTALAIKNE